MKKTTRPAARKRRKPAAAARPSRLAVANWKMNPLAPDAARDIFKRIAKSAKGLRNTRVVVCPPSVYLSELAKLSKGAVDLGAQNAHWEQSGSFTGEVSAAMERSLGADYCIIGHSERRAMGETDADVSRKLAAALRNGMKAIVCVGEKERDVHGGAHLKFIEDEVKGSLGGLMRRDLSRVIVAYEPIWAIGKSDAEAMTGADLHETALYIRKVLAGMYGKDAAFGVPLLYGGSVTFRNARDIVAEGRVDGLLVGRQSLEPEGFAELLRAIDSIDAHENA